MDFDAIEAEFNERFRDSAAAEPITFHAEEWPQAVGAGVTLAVDGSPLRAVFGIEPVEVLTDGVVPVVTRQIRLEVRAADLAARPIAARPDGEGGHQWAIRGVIYRTVKVEDATPGWIVCQLQRSG